MGETIKLARIKAVRKVRSKSSTGTSVQVLERVPGDPVATIELAEGISLGKLKSLMESGQLVIDGTEADPEDVQDGSEEVAGDSEAEKKDDETGSEEAAGDPGNGEAGSGGSEGSTETPENTGGKEDSSEEKSSTDETGAAETPPPPDSRKNKSGKKKTSKKKTSKKSD